MKEKLDNGGILHLGVQTKTASGSELFKFLVARFFKITLIRAINTAKCSLIQEDNSPTYIDDFL